MKRQPIISLFGALIFASMVLLVRCAAEGETQETGFAGEVVDSVSAAIVENLRNAPLEKHPLQNAPSTKKQVCLEPIKLISNVTDIVLFENKIYGVFEQGVAIYNLTHKTQELIRSDEKLDAIAVHEGRIYVGGSSLYELAGSSLERLDEDYAGVIKCLYSYDYRLMIGTECELYSRSSLGRELLLSSVSVQAMTHDPTGLWVGTGGQGLYRWDGTDFKQRYLLRDTSLFDTVNTLDYQHSHLYMGTNNGLHIHDGGRWQTYTLMDGLPSEIVRTIDASGWVVYIGTDGGVVSLFNDEILPVETLDSKKVNALLLKGRNLLAATDYEGILMKRGNVLKALIQPINDKETNFLSLIE